VAFRPGEKEEPERQKIFSPRVLLAFLRFTTRRQRDWNGACNYPITVGKQAAKVASPTDSQVGAFAMVTMEKIDLKELNQADHDTASANDPSPEEIRKRAAAIRKGWSPNQRKRRRVTVRVGWLPPQVSDDQWAASIESAFQN
jgi:hypothetical protein